MSYKGQVTKSDYIEWNRFQLLLHQLETDKEYKFCLLIGIGVYSGLRISDILTLRWKDVLKVDQLTITEKKTKKQRIIDLNEVLQKLILRLYKQQKLSEYIFVNRWGYKPVGVQYINRKLKEIAIKYEIEGNISTHSMRKTFGRRIWSKNNYSDQSLILLGEIFNHSSVAITKVYLGIKAEEIKNVYLSL